MTEEFNRKRLHRVNTERSVAHLDTKRGIVLHASEPTERVEKGENRTRCDAKNLKKPTKTPGFSTSPQLQKRACKHPSQEDAGRRIGFLDDRVARHHLD